MAKPTPLDRADEALQQLAAAWRAQSKPSTISQEDQPHA